jgi:methionyl aminopeptidase
MSLSSSKTDTINPAYVRAGQISREVRKEVEGRNWVGRTYLELCDFVEEQIRNRGAQPAFPTNICANASAAHNTAEVDDQRIVEDGVVLKVDIGAHVNGYLSDTAVTLCYNDELLDLAEAAKSALNEALKVIKAGMKVSDVGHAVETYASRRGYLPISNLSGHSLDLYEVHAGTSVPNVWSPSGSSFRQDKIYAVEPFLTTQGGSGVVIEGASENIFSLVTRKKTKNDRLDDFVDSIWNTCRTLPFAARWFAHDYSKQELSTMVSKLKKMKMIRSYPELVEARGHPVAQAEHTVAPTLSGLVILT